MSAKISNALGSHSGHGSAGNGAPESDPYALGFVARINMLRTPHSYVNRTIEHDAGQARWNALSEREQDARVRAAMERQCS